MPDYRNPKFAYVEPRRNTVAALVAVIVLAVEVYSGYELAAWLASIADVILAVLSVVAAGSLAVLAVVLHRNRGRQHLDAPQWVVDRCGAPRISSQGAVPARPAPAITARPQPAIAPAVHYHLHLNVTPAARSIATEESN